MVIQTCKKCKSSIACGMESLDNYCGTCGSQEFKLRAESDMEWDREPFNGRKILSYKGQK